MGTFLVAQLVKNLPAMQETPVWFLGGKIPWRRDSLSTPVFLGFPGSSDGKESTCNAGDLGSIPGYGRSSGAGHRNRLQYSCLENPHGQRSLAGYSPWGCKECDNTEWLSTAQQKERMWRVHSRGMHEHVGKEKSFLCAGLALCGLLPSGPPQILPCVISTPGALSVSFITPFYKLVSTSVPLGSMSHSGRLIKIEEGSQSLWFVVKLNRSCCNLGPATFISILK